MIRDLGAGRDGGLCLRFMATEEEEKWRRRGPGLVAGSISTCDLMMSPQMTFVSRATCSSTEDIISSSISCRLSVTTLVFLSVGHGTIPSQRHELSRFLFHCFSRHWVLVARCLYGDSRSFCSIFAWSWLACVLVLKGVAGAEDTQEPRILRDQSWKRTWRVAHLVSTAQCNLNFG